MAHSISLPILYHSSPRECNSFSYRGFIALQIRDKAQKLKGLRNSMIRGIRRTPQRGLAESHIIIR